MDMGVEADLWQKLTEGPVFLVAEIGKNFIQSEEEATPEEYLTNAKELVLAAKAAGAGAVKFQTHWVEDEQLPVQVVSPHFNGADRYSWVKRNTEATPLGWWRELKAFCDEVGVLFFSTPMSRGAAQLLADVGVPLWKVGSGDILDFVLLDYLRQRPEPIIVSSGMSSLAELDRALDYLWEKTDRVVLLHCVSKYPCEPGELHLNVIHFFQERYRGLPIGFSDHSLGFSGALVAASLGAQVIEKHFSLSRELWGSDHKVSMLPDEFAEMAKRVRGGDIEVGSKDGYLGGPVQGDLFDSESAFRPFFRKSLVAAGDIKAGEVVAPEMVYAMRPQGEVGGLPSEEYVSVVGARALADVAAGQVLTGELVEGRVAATVKA